MGCVSCKKVDGASRVIVSKPIPQIIIADAEVFSDIKNRGDDST